VKPGDMVCVRKGATLWYSADGPRSSTVSLSDYHFAEADAMALVVMVSPYKYGELLGLIAGGRALWCGTAYVQRLKTRH
jgi:hypothetical protein